ncbi:pentatricopeptide repeat-containing protein At1g50270-like [Solanum tuberosum]|uniref:pentatricopeptide repeat-containing protein At1g50270-like n=1 Tax=Solanum tuberosum TaxID=4113 RepID=UPI00073A45CE|nr:PREDICTED: pentatricopeptide repeat-containing protein At1g50270-like [Solanum tuberosum]
MYNAIDGVGRGGSYLYESDGVVMTRDPKPRLMWTAELRQQFVDAVTKLGGLDSQDSLLFFFASSGYVHLARQVFDDITHKDVLSYTALIDGYARNALPIRALKLFLEMRRAQVKVDEVVLVAALSPAGTLRCVWFGKYLHGFYVKPGRVSRDVYIGSVLVDMYAKCGF